MQEIATLAQRIQNLNEIHGNSQTQEKRNKVLGKKIQLEERRKTLCDQMKWCNSGKENVQRLILQEANIICCTLSTSGGVDLQTEFPSQLQDDVPFNCVIIDEAGQAKETETLIPLLFRCPSLVLVGDPEQLPPTVKSQKTKELRFDQSLMDRLHKCVQLLSPPHTHFLSQQYRMHVDIQNFPSKYFYGNLLKADRTIAQSRCSSDWACKSYRVFDVADGQEMREREKVVVDSVSRFQGRENDCIIVSCVRSSNKVDSTEFLGSRQQINVAITRAKYSLFILGHLSTLKKHRNWEPLIEDAESRGIIIKTEERHLVHARKILKEDDAYLSPPHRTQDRSLHPSNGPHLF
ncbi:probable helicase senataxin isoform X6 [Alosa alosa]|uniref:probable helicase senataxin isoform X6 n=1 Tax=Alosa alosa TaxID=278164 RepID=UPI0020150A49|nr:probable helicase senataxin isoform X6 [Alosa alosa]